MSRYFLRSLFVVGTALVLSFRATPASAAGRCCGGELAPAPGRAAEWPTYPGRHWALVPLSSWMFSAPAAGRSRSVAGSRQLDYMVERHLWLMGGVRTLPTGRPLTPATSNADRTAYSLAGLGVGYTLSPSARAITNWTTGLGPYTVSRGSQFTVGVALRY